MTIQFNYIRIIKKHLENNSWKSSGMGYSKWGVFVMDQKGSRKVALVLPLDIYPWINVQDQINNYFERLERFFNKNPITDIYFQGGEGELLFHKIL